MNYTLKVSKDGDPSTELYSKNEHGRILKLSNGYERIVIGGRGPYVEFDEDQIVLSSFHVPKDQLFRFSDKRIYYIEMRSIDSAFVKLYYQLKTVSYADYKIGKFYISPFDLYLEDGSCIVKSNTVVCENEFFT